MSVKFLKASRAVWVRREKYRKNKHAQYVARNSSAGIAKWSPLLHEARRMVALRDKQIAAASPLRLRAYKVALELVGVMEQGGNNQGSMVTKIIRANGGTYPEPWCGDFCAYCYRLAGSKAVTRAWASVSLLGRVAGVKRTKNPVRGNLVRFTFDHVGIFDSDNGDGTIMVIEGNTGASGAVSDGDGGDGVYRKRRSKGLVNDYLTVTR